MKKFFIFYFLLISQSLFSQNRFFFSLDGGPTYSYRSLYSTNKDKIWKNVIKQIDKNEGGRFGFKISGTLGFELSKRLAISSGVEYLKIGESGKMIAENHLVDSLNFGREEKKVFYDYYYISIPLILEYKLVNRKVEIKPQIGFSIDFLTKKTFTWKNGQNEDFQGKMIFYNYKNLVLSGRIGVELAFKISDKVRFYLNPSYSRALTTSATFEIDPEPWIMNAKFDTSFKQFNYYFTNDLGLRVYL
ncbi:MAG TPA: outer membrane beta-barrel protein [Cytophagales bacterium]|nr:outer membrane beta-barrel protein [Cytophagales bacterium]